MVSNIKVGLDVRQGIIKRAKGYRDIFLEKRLRSNIPGEPNLPPRSHGFLRFGKCTACGICRLSCPNEVITVNSVRDENRGGF